MRARGRGRRLAVVSAAVAGAAALVVGFAGHGSAGQQPPPGVSAGVSALKRVPPKANLPAPVVRFVNTAASARATNPQQALTRVRKLRSKLGTTRADVYAFENAAGAPCFILVGHVGLCPASPSDGNPGLQWTIGGGYGDLPSNLVGIAGDDVRRVELTVDGAAVPVTLQNNVVFGEYPSSGKRAKVTIVRKDGTRSADEVQLEQPLKSFADIRAQVRARARAASHR
jgi:hypothetical protein